MKKVSEVFILFLLFHCSKANCPSKEDLEFNNGQPNVAQVSSGQVIVDWSSLWIELDFDLCVESVSLVLNDGQSEIEVGVGDRNVSVEVEPCTEVRFQVKVILKSQGQEEEGDLELLSFRSLGGFKTFKGPKVKDDPKFQVSFVHS